MFSILSHVLPCMVLLQRDLHKLTGGMTFISHTAMVKNKEFFEKSTLDICMHQPGPLITQFKPAPKTSIVVYTAGSGGLVQEAMELPAPIPEDHKLYKLAKIMQLLNKAVPFEYFEVGHQALCDPSIHSCGGCIHETWLELCMGGGCCTHWLQSLQPHHAKPPAVAIGLLMLGAGTLRRHATAVWCGGEIILLQHRPWICCIKKANGAGLQWWGMDWRP